MTIALLTFVVVVARRKEMLKYIPGFVCIWFTFLSTNLEALVLGDLFNLMEHLFILFSALFMLLAIFIEFYSQILKQKLAEQTNI
ncbi:MAG: hypothetical protein GF317_06790 [Candidatus Lokiarchaeota archaeon]|nr:hypothetical protein [Candidatus Lokiarchaeota archaeon]MBD3199416.1 hypothetical protein [Candidatus Lokiarchaeota archaeon]